MKIDKDLHCSCIHCDWKGSYMNHMDEVQFFAISPGSTPKVCYACAFSFGQKAKYELLRRVSKRVTA